MPPNAISPLRIEEEIKSRFRNERHKATVNLIYTNNVIEERIRGLLRQFGLSTQQFNVLRILRGQNGAAVPISLIRERMLDKNSDASRIVDRLESKNLLVCQASENDRRRRDVKISDRGLKLLKDVGSVESELDASLNQLSEKEVTQLNKLLDKIRG